MQAIMETLFDIVYLISVITMGILMIKRSNTDGQDRLFGIMAVILGCGDAFHLVPRAYALCTDGLEAHAASLGFGKLVTSITMTVFYVILYHIWEKRYYPKGNSLKGAVYGLALVRVVLCMFPQNDWLSAAAPVSWGIIRNIPFAILGLLIIVIFYQETKKRQDGDFRFMWLAVLLSFGFYIPVVLFSQTVPVVGILMIPKTCAYVWIVVMGFRSKKRFS